MSRDLALEAFGRRLRDQRKTLSLNQIEFGKLAGASENSQTAYEKGKTPPNVSYLLRLAEHGVDIGYVLTGRRNDRGLAADQELLFELFSKLSAREREATMALITTLVGEPISTTEIAARRVAAPQSLHEKQTGFRGSGED